jgi:hypothetical protein
MTMATQEFIKLDDLISKCNSNNTRKSVGKILEFPTDQIELLLTEFDRKPDVRFGDNLLYACDIVKRLRQDWNYSAIFRD